MTPETAVRRQRFGLEHIERSAAQRAVVETRENVGLVLQAAAAGIDQHGRAERTAAAEFCKYIAVENVARVRREGQQAHQNVSLAQERVEAIRAMKTLHAFNVLRAAAPARHAKGKPPQDVGGVRP